MADAQGSCNESQVQGQVAHRVISSDKVPVKRRNLGDMLALHKAGFRGKRQTKRLSTPRISAKYLYVKMSACNSDHVRSW